MANELDIARAIRDGVLPSPQKYGALWLFSLRISGTGQAFRQKLNEAVFRSPEVYLNPEFLERCQGLPVIVEHPKKSVLDTDEYRQRVIGAVMLPFIRGDEVWSICRIHDQEAAEAMRDLPLSTSPAIVLRSSETQRSKTKDGTLLIEGEPALLDHVAICTTGVWDKGEVGSGIERSDEQMSDEENKREGGELLDKMLAKMDSAVTKFGDVADTLGQRMDKIDGRLEALERGRDDRGDRRDRRDDDPETRERREPGMATPVAADAWDSDERKDPAYHNKMADAQARADNAFSCWGEKAPRFLQGEGLTEYRKRLLGYHKRHSARYKTADLNMVTDPTILNEIEQQIYADSAQAAVSPESVPGGMLRMITERGEGGHLIHRFTGHPRSWMEQFGGARRKFVTSINPKGERVF